MDSFNSKTGNKTGFSRDAPRERQVASTWAIRTSGIHLTQYLLEPHFEHSFRQMVWASIRFLGPSEHRWKIHAFPPGWVTVDSCSILRKTKTGPRHILGRANSCSKIQTSLPPLYLIISTRAHAPPVRSLTLTRRSEMARPRPAK